MKYHWLYNNLLQLEKGDLLSTRDRKCFHLKYGKHVIIYTPQIWNFAFKSCAEDFSVLKK